MATYYWSGTGTWDNSSTANWYNGTGGTGGNAASAPNSADTVILNAASGAGTCTVASTAACAVVTMTGFTGTLAFGASGKITVTAPASTTVVTGGTTFTVTGTNPLIEVIGSSTITLAMGAMTEANSISVTFLSGNDTRTCTGSFRNLICSPGCLGTFAAGARTIYGDFTLASGMGTTSTANVTTFAATSGTQTITTNGCLVNFHTAINAPGATVQLGDAYDTGFVTSRYISLVAGTLTTNNHNLTLGQFYSTGAATRALNLGSSTVKITGSIWDNTGSTNFTLNAGTSTIFFSSTSPKTFNPGTGFTYYNIKNAGSGSTDARLSVTQSSSYNQWQADTLPCTYQVTVGTTHTMAEFPQSGASASQMFCIGPSAYGSTYTLSKASGTWGGTHLWIKGATFTGGATWTATNSADAGENSGGSILYTGVARYWVGGSGTWDTTSTANWSATNGGAAGASAPGPGDYAYFPSGTTGTVTLGANVTVSKWEVIGTPTFTFAFNGYKIICDWLGECYKTATGMTVTGTARVDLSYAGAWSRGPDMMRCGTSNGTILEANTISMYVTAGSATTATAARLKTADFTGFTGALQIQQVRSVFGSWIMHSGMTDGGGGTTTFAGTSGVQEIYCGGATFGSTVTFSGVGGTFRFMDAFSTTSTRVVSLFNGTLDANNFNVTIGIFGGATTTARTLNMGSGTWTLLGTSSGNSWICTPSTNMTLNAGTSLILLSTTTKNFHGGSLTYYNISNNGSGVLTISGSNTFNDIQNAYASTGATTIRFTAGTTQTVANFTASGQYGRVLTLDSSSAGSPATISKASGTVAPNYLSVRDITATGGATWRANVSTNVSGNTGWTFDNALYWVGGSGAWDSTSQTPWAATSGGAGGVGVPSFTEVAKFDANSDSGGPFTVTVSGSGGRCGSVDASGLDQNMTLAGSATYFEFRGGLNLAGGRVTWSSASTVYFNPTGGSYTITTGGTTISGLVIFQGAGSTYTLQDAFTGGFAVYFQRGTFDANNFNITARSYLAAADASPRTVTMGSGTWTATNWGLTVWDFPTQTGLTVNAGTSTILCTSSGGYKAVSLGAYTWGTIAQGGSGRLDITHAGATVADITNPYKTTGASAIRFTAGQTLTVGALTASGEAGRVLTIDSTTPGSAATLSDPSGVVALSHVSLRDITATGGATFNAYTTLGNTNVSGNLGWNFTAPSSGGGGNFFLFF